MANLNDLDLKICATEGDIPSEAPEKDQVILVRGESDGVPIGGTSGQILAKQSAADFDTEWIDPPSGGGGGEVPYIYTCTGVDDDIAINNIVNAFLDENTSGEVNLKLVVVGKVGGSSGFDFSGTYAADKIIYMDFSAATIDNSFEPPSSGGFILFAVDAAVLYVNGLYLRMWSSDEFDEFEEPFTFISLSVFSATSNAKICVKNSHIAVRGYNWEGDDNLPTRIFDVNASALTVLNSYLYADNTGNADYEGRSCIVSTEGACDVLIRCCKILCHSGSMKQSEQTIVVYTANTDSAKANIILDSNNVFMSSYRAAVGNNKGLVVTTSANVRYKIINNVVDEGSTGARAVIGTSANKPEIYIVGNTGVTWYIYGSTSLPTAAAGVYMPEYANN